MNNPMGPALDEKWITEPHYVTLAQQALYRLPTKDEVRGWFTAHGLMFRLLWLDPPESEDGRYFLLIMMERFQRDAHTYCKVAAPQ